MATLSNDLDLLNKRTKDFVILIMRPFIIFFGKYSKKNREKIKAVIKGHQELIEQFKEIEEGVSKLSSNQRKLVRARVVHLVGKGHIKIS